MTRLAWLLGNWLAQIVFAFRIGYRDGSVLRPGSRPRMALATTDRDPDRCIYCGGKECTCD